jgi:serine/threonine protein kinase
MSALVREKDSSYTITTKTGKYSISSSNVINPLGKGAFGTVYCANNTQNNVKVAIKQMNKAQNSPDVVKREIETMLKVTKPDYYNVLTIIDYYEDNLFYYIVTPFCDKGMLTNVINRGLINSEELAIEMFRQICYGLMILHSHNIIHRDLKTDNILVNSYEDPSYPYKLYLLISDFGLAKEMTEKSMLDNTINVGTEFTKAPEVETRIYDMGADIYSAGCILYKMLFKKDPFPGSTIKEIKDRKKLSALTLPNKLPVISCRILEGCLHI